MTTYRVYYAATDEDLYSIDTTADDWEEACSLVRALNATVLFSGGDEQARKDAAEFTAALEFTTTYKGLTYDAATPRLVVPGTRADSSDFPDATFEASTGFVISGMSAQWRKHMNSAERAHAGADLGPLKGAAYPDYELDSTSLVYHLDAGTLVLNDGDPVTTWTSLETGHVASDVQSPTYVASSINGLPAVRLNGTDRLALSTTGSLYDFSSGGTMVMVFKMGSDASDTAGFFQVGYTLSDPKWQLRGKSGSNKLTLFTELSTSSSWDTDDDVIEIDVPMIISYRQASGSSTGYLYKDGVEVGNGFVYTLSGKSQYDTTRIGHNTSLTHMDSDIPEFLLLNREITTTEHTDLIDHLKTKYGIT